MSGTIDFNASLSVSNGLFNDQFAPQAQQIAETNLGVVGGTHSIPTADTLIPELTGLTAEGLCVMQNLDATNYLTWGPDNGSGAMVVAGKLKPGEFCVFRLAPTVILRANADTAALLLFCRIYED